MSEATRMDLMLDRVDWKAIPREADFTPHDNLPVATHEGILDICGQKLRVFQLSDGTRLIDKDDFESFFAEW